MELFSRTMVGEQTYAYPSSKDTLHCDHIHLALIGEGEHQKSIQHLKENDIQANAYLGFGGAINLSYVLAAKPKIVRLCDINPFQTFFWKQTVKAIRHFEYKNDFNDFLIKSEKELPALLRYNFSKFPFSKTNGLSSYFDTIHGAQLPWESKKGPFRSMDSIAKWLESNNRPDLLWFKHYDEFRNIILDADVSASTIDIYDSASITEIADELRLQNPLQIAIYTSSIGRFSDWAGRRVNNLKQRLTDNIKLLESIAPQSITIDDREIVIKKHILGEKKTLSFERRLNGI